MPPASRTLRRKKWHTYKNLSHTARSTSKEIFQCPHNASLLNLRCPDGHCCSSRRVDVKSIDRTSMPPKQGNNEKDKMENISMHEGRFF